MRKFGLFFLMGCFSSYLLAQEGKELDEWMRQVHQDDSINKFYQFEYDGAKGCDSVTLSAGDFEYEFKIVENQFDPKYLFIAAKSLIATNCLKVSQLELLMGLLIYEDSRYDLLEYSYRKTIDQENYPKLLSLFSNEIFRDKFKKFLDSKGLKY